MHTDFQTFLYALDVCPRPYSIEYRVAFLKAKKSPHSGGLEDPHKSEGKSQAVKIYPELDKSPCRGCGADQCFPEGHAL